MWDCVKRKFDKLWFKPRCTYDKTKSTDGVSHQVATGPTIYIKDFLNYSTYTCRIYIPCTINAQVAFDHWLGHYKPVMKMSLGHFV